MIWNNRDRDKGERIIDTKRGEMWKEKERMSAVVTESKASSHRVVIS